MSQYTNQDENVAFGAPRAIFGPLIRAASHGRAWTQANAEHSFKKVKEDRIWSFLTPKHSFLASVKCLGAAPPSYCPRRN